MSNQTIQIADYYNTGETVNIRAEAIKLGEQDAATLGYSHYAKINEGQIKKMSLLSNGPRRMNVTKQDELGREIEAEVYFNL
tara:strand:+ start:88 stop:333 length:246 start_codon:yes stop_codon:yes gene_type:complete